MNNLFFILISLALLGMTGCATYSPASRPETPVPVVGSPVGVLSSLETWDLDALIAIRNAAKSRGDSAHLHWQQIKQNYTISIFGPMGSNAMILSGQPGSVVLEKSTGEKVHASSPEALLTEETGWQLPVSSLFYWIRGLPAPQQSAQTYYDQNHRLQLLLQQGWRIEYSKFTKTKTMELPSVLSLNNAQLDIKIVINKWRID